MTTIALIAAGGDPATDKLVHRLTRNGPHVRVPADAQQTTDLLAGPTDVVIITAATHGGADGSWYIGPAADPVLTAWQVPETINTKLLIVNVPAAEEIATHLRRRTSATVLVAPHSKAGTEYAEDSERQLWEFVASAYDRYEPESDTLLTVWNEVFADRLKEAGSLLHRSRQPLPYRVL